ncbi:Uncharacterized protein Adt_32432 [Abeliophyllum distichum]|uniref:Putative plant transposon protein domain-containing protein n=1 Tax=Abeliophyllum distichum TaxID=126358 RepID=A0ABD1QTD2_9LAMI
MVPKRKITTQEKGNGKVSEGSNRRRRAEEPTSDSGIPRFLTPEAQESYVDKWKGKNYHQERMVHQADFQGHLLEHKIDTPELSHRHKTWVRGKWIRFSPVMIDRYDALNRTRIDPMSTEGDMQSVTRFLYGRENAWPLATSHFKHDELTQEIRALHIFVCTNINPTTQRTKFIEEMARLLYHLARGRKMDLGTHIFDFFQDLATSVDSNSQRSIMFPSVQPDETAHDPAPPVPQPALAADTNLSIQFTQIQVALTKIDRSVNDMQNTLVGVQHTQNNMQQELLRVGMLVRRWQHDGIDIQSNQRTINYAFDDINRRMIHLESRIETINGTISQIVEAVNSLRPFTSAASSDQPRPPSPPLPPGIT